MVDEFFAKSCLVLQGPTSTPSQRAVVAAAFTATKACACNKPALAVARDMICTMSDSLTVCLDVSVQREQQQKNDGWINDE